MTTAAHLALFERVVAAGATPQQARHAVAAACAELMSASMPHPAYIDVDLCTAHLIAIRYGNGSTRFLPLASIQLIVGAAMQQTEATTTTNPVAPHVNTIH